MERDEIEAALRELATELDRRHVAARISIVGGAVMVLAFKTRFSTADVDASYFPPEDVAAVAAEIARRLGLPADWLNDGAKIFTPSYKEPDWRPVFKAGAVEVVAADARAMLAMKLRASRGQRDRSDVGFLLKHLGITNREQAVAL